MLIHGLFVLGKNGCTHLPPSHPLLVPPRVTHAATPRRRRNIVLEKHWTVGVHRQLTELFHANVQAAANPDDVAPVFATPRHVLIHVKRNDLFFIGVVGREVPLVPPAVAVCRPLARPLVQWGRWPRGRLFPPGRACAPGASDGWWMCRRRRWRRCS